jgi:hypothetical protein
MAKHKQQSKNSLSRIQALARSIPSLAKAPGIRPWKPDKLARWAASHQCTDQADYSARFVLELWNRDWECGRFPLTDAPEEWDLPRRQAFANWVTEIWWP